MRGAYEGGGNYYYFFLERHPPVCQPAHLQKRQKIRPPLILRFACLRTPPAPTKTTTPSFCALCANFDLSSANLKLNLIDFLFFCCRKISAQRKMFMVFQRFSYNFLKTASKTSCRKRDEYLYQLQGELHVI